MAGMGLANALVIAVAARLGLVHASAPDPFYGLVQEDGALQWGAFWAAANRRTQGRAGRR